MGGWDDFAVFSTSVLDSCGCVQVFHGCIVFTHKYYRKMNWMILKHVKYEHNWEGEDDFKKWRSEILHCCLLTGDRGAVAVGGQRQKRAGSLYQGLSYTLFCLLYHTSIPFSFPLNALFQGPFFTFPFHAFVVYKQMKQWLHLLGVTTCPTSPYTVILKSFKYLIYKVSDPLWLQIFIFTRRNAGLIFSGF